MKEYWFPWAPTKFRQDTMHLSDDQELIYRRIIDFYMETGGALPDNDQALANIARVTLSKFQENSLVIRKFFNNINEGKATAKLRLKRCEAILADQAERSRSYAERGKKGGRKKSNENKGPKATAKLKASTGQDKTIQKGSPTDSRPSASAPEIQMAFSLFNETAKRSGIPPAMKLNPTRTAKLKKRLEDVGGLDGWKEALRKTEASDFLTGRVNGFKATLDFLLQEASFTKLMEGNYDNENNRRHSEKLDQSDVARREVAKAFLENHGPGDS